MWRGRNMRGIDTMQQDVGVSGWGIQLRQAKHLGVHRI